VKIDIPELAEDVVVLVKCCHGGGTEAAETAGGGIGGGMEGGKCPTLTGGNLGAAEDMAHGGGGPDSYKSEHTALNNNNKMNVTNYNPDDTICFKCR